MQIQLQTQFSTTKFPATAERWTLSASDPLVPLSGTLVLRGSQPYTVGTSITVDGRDYTITNVSEDKSGTSVTTTLTTRDALYELLVTTAPTAISWITAPSRIIKQETLNNIELPADTKLYAKEGDAFGVGGWKVSEIIKECASIAGLSCQYNLPDFWIKQVTLERFQPLLEFIQSLLNPFLPRIYVANGVLVIQPFKAYNAYSFNALAAETIISSTTYAEPFKTLRVHGGTAEFKRSKWEGKTLLTTASPNNTYYLNSIVGSVTTLAQAGTRTYYQTFSDAQSISRVRMVYSRDIFGNDAFLLFREEWRFIRKVPLIVSDLTDLDAMSETLRESVITTSTPGAWPSSADYYLDSCERMVNVYEAHSLDWEQPVLVTTHKAIWKYLWWDSRRIPSTPGYAYDGPMGVGYTSLIYPDRLGQQVLPGKRSGIVGVWSNEALYERTDYNYEFKESDDEGVVGGILESKTSVAMGVARSLCPNLDSTGALITVLDDQRYVAAYLQEDGSPGFGYPSANPFIKFSSEIETYTEVSLRTVLKTRSTSKVSTQQLAWYDAYGREIASSTASRGFTQYTNESEQTLVPIGEVPQVLSRKRGMRCYASYSGSGRRVVEIDLPLIVSWSDLTDVSAMVRSVHSQVQNICTRTILIPGRVELTGAMFGGSITVPEETVTGRIIAGNYTVTGSGEQATQLVVQEET